MASCSPTRGTRPGIRGTASGTPGPKAQRLMRKTARRRSDQSSGTVDWSSTGGENPHMIGCRRRRWARWFSSVQFSSAPGASRSSTFFHQDAGKRRWLCPFIARNGTTSIQCGEGRRSPLSRQFVSAAVKVLLANKIVIRGRFHSRLAVKQFVSNEMKFRQVAKGSAVS